MRERTRPHIWWEIDAGRGLLELTPPTAHPEHALELEVWWGDGKDTRTHAVWLLSRTGSRLGVIEGCIC